MTRKEATEGARTVAFLWQRLPSKFAAWDLDAGSWPKPAFSPPNREPKDGRLPPFSRLVRGSVSIPSARYRQIKDAGKKQVATVAYDYVD